MSPDGEQAMTELFTRVGPRLERIVAHFRIPAAEAEDLLQEVWLSAVRHWERLENPEAWLSRAFYLICCAHCGRRKKRQRLHYMDVPLLETLAPAEKPAQERTELLRDLSTLAAFLSQRDRLLLQLRYVLGLSCAETAIRLGCRPGSVRKLSARALARMRQGVRREGGERPD
jgi:RNA polymerase sigma-70 factor (ECF subfamily)